MISLTDFAEALTLEASDLKSAVGLAESIRAQGDDEPYRIRIAPSVCRGPLKTAVSGFFFDGGGKAEITGDLSANDRDLAGHELTTWKTATFTFLGSHCLFRGLTFTNTRGRPETNGQQVALEVLGTDNLFDECSLVSTQDTLFCGPLPDDLVVRYLGFLPDDERYREGNCRNYFHHCRIAGSIDFVFGAGQAVFASCRLISVDDGRPGPFYVAAPAHSLKDAFGFVFADCRFETALNPVKPVYLARPWRDFGKCVFLDCTYGPHIRAEGVSDWDGLGRDRTARFEEYPLKPGRASFMNRDGQSDPGAEILAETARLLKGD